MYVFLLGASLTSVSETVQKSARVTLSMMPKLGAELRSDYHELEAGRIAWFTIGPASARRRPLIHQYTSDDVVAIVYGELFIQRNEQTAATVVEAWRAGGLEAVRELNGSFSAILINRRDSTLQVVSDIVGTRTVRRGTVAEKLLISSHDMPLIATGLLSTSWNVGTACSIVARNWSLGGESLLSGATVGSPHETIFWQAGKLQVQLKPIDFFADRLAPQDRKGCQRHLQKMTEVMRESARELLSAESVVRVELTAGIDSRAILGIVLSTIEPARVTATTSGVGHSPDVRVARRIANLQGIGHSNWSRSTPSLDDYLGNVDVLAFYRNGDTNAKRALADPFVCQSQQIMRLSGVGGELYRGLGGTYGDYYGQGALNKLQGKRVEQVRDFVIHSRILAQLDWISWKSPEMRQLVLDRTDRVLATLTRLSDVAADVLDLFYLFERIARWSIVERSDWRTPAYALFSDRNLVRMTWKLPPPIGRFCGLQRQVIRHMLPKTWWIAINGRHFLPLQGQPAPLRNAFHATRRSWLRMQKQMRRPSSLDARNNDAVYSAGMADLMRGPVRDIIQRKDGIATTILGAANLQRMIDDVVAGKRRYVESLGSLITMERWRALAEETRRLEQARAAVE